MKYRRRLKNQLIKGAELWWINPTKLILFFIFPLALFVVGTSQYTIYHNRIGYTSPYYVTFYYILLYLFGILVLALGTALTKYLPMSRPKNNYISSNSLDFLFFMCIAGYVIWFAPLFFLHFGLVVGALIGSPGATFTIRNLSTTTPGLTTLTQFGIPYVCIYLINSFNNVGVTNRRHKTFFWIIILASLIRAVIYSERVAFLELFLPIVLITASSNVFPFLRYIRAVLRLLPIISLMAAPVFFAIFEYSRSWVIKFNLLYDNILQFSYDRLVIYYVSSLNNICGYLSNSDWPDWTGQFTFRWLYRFPLVGDFMSHLVGSGFEINAAFITFVSRTADLEFNNSTGVLVAYHDFGVFGGGVFLLLYGLIVGILYRSYRRRDGGFQYIYPMAFYSLYEILRIGYFWDGRAVSAYVGFIIVYIIWGKSRSAKSRPATTLAPQFVAEGDLSP